jgi:hypothetical protein
MAYPYLTDIHGTAPPPLFRCRRPRGPCHARGGQTPHPAAAAVAADTCAGARDRRDPLRAPSPRRQPDRCRPLLPGRCRSDPRGCRQGHRAGASYGARRDRRIAVGFTTSAPFHPLVARAIREFRSTRPDVSFVLEESSSGELLTGLREERLDIAFIRAGLADPQGLTVHALLHEEMSAALPARHRLTRRPKLTLKDLAAEDFILYRRPDGRGLYDVILAACSEAGFSPHVSQEAPRIVSTLNLVAAGLGITIVPASLSRLPLEGCNLSPPHRAACAQGAAQPGPAAATSIRLRRWASSIWSVASHETDQDHRPFQPSDRTLRRSPERSRHRSAGRRALDTLFAALPAVRS